MQAAIDSANRYLSVAGRKGKYYREALELLVKAERELQEPAPNPVGKMAASSEIEPQPQAEPPSSPQAVKVTTVQPVVDCEQWNTERYFRKASVEDVTACLAAGADPKARDKWKNTPLHSARFNENPAVIEVLLQAGAGLEARNKWKSTPLHWAGRSNENPEVVETLLKAGADPKARDMDRRTPLHYAASFNENPAVVETLLKAGADPKEQDKYKWTPLHYAACCNENPAVIEALLKAGGRPEGAG